MYASEESDSGNVTDDFKSVGSQDELATADHTGHPASNPFAEPSVEPPLHAVAPGDSQSHRRTLVFSEIAI